MEIMKRKVFHGFMVFSFAQFWYGNYERKKEIKFIIFLIDNKKIDSIKEQFTNIKKLISKYEIHMSLSSINLIGR